MQVRDAEKRERIRCAAAKLFASRPYHRVRLEDVASAAGVGKGTLYVYFEDKEDLYLSVHAEEFSDLLANLRREIDGAENPLDALDTIVREIVAHAFSHPQIFELMRTVGIAVHPQWQKKRQELTGLIERVIREGTEKGVISDSRPGLTALYIPGLVRSAMVYGERDQDQRIVADHIAAFVRTALAVEEER